LEATLSLLPNRQAVLEGADQVSRFVGRVAGIADETLSDGLDGAGVRAFAGHDGAFEANVAALLRADFALVSPALVKVL